MTEKPTTTNPVSVFVPYDVIFSGCPATFERFKRVVKSLSSTDALFWCGRLNLILADPSIDEKTTVLPRLFLHITADREAE
jgi:coenzyme F420-reducing hydrogenase gamma subunit